MVGAHHCDIINKYRNDLTCKAIFYVPYVVGHNFKVCELHIELDFTVLVKVWCAVQFSFYL